MERPSGAQRAEKEKSNKHNINLSEEAHPKSEEEISTQYSHFLLLGHTTNKYLSSIEYTPSLFLLE